MAPKMTNGQNLPELNPLHFLTLVVGLVVVLVEFGDDVECNDDGLEKK